MLNLKSKGGDLFDTNNSTTNNSTLDSVMLDYSDDTYLVE